MPYMQARDVTNSIILHMVSNKHNKHNINQRILTIFCNTIKGENR